MSKCPSQFQSRRLDMNRIPSQVAASSEALVVFGATGDLAHKMIFPALYALCKRGALAVPVIGVASSAWSLERFRAFARTSIEGDHGVDDEAALERLLSQLQFVSGDYNDADTFAGLSMR